MRSEMTMRAVIELLGLQDRYQITDTSSNNVCPECRNRKRENEKKLSIDFRIGAFNCYKCGFHGGMLDFWAYHRGIPKSEASRDFWRAYNGMYGGARPKRPAPPPVTPAEIPQADPDHVDSVYRELLGMLSLNKAHRQNLLDRGHTDDGIRNGIYRSCPRAILRSIPNKLIKRGFDLSGVPGFYKKEGTWAFRRYGEGIIIPSLDLEGRISALQMRLDTPEKPSDDVTPTRYLTVSTSGFDNGTRGPAAPHFVLGRRGYDEVIITEGALKGNIISDISGYSVLAVLGVNSTSRLPGMLTELRKRGTTKIRMAFDMDFLSNENVERAYAKLESTIYRMGFRFCKEVWDPQTDEDGNLLYKGLDDYLAWLAKK